MEGFKKYDKIRTVGSEENDGIFANPDDEIIVQEKIDGANMRFTFSDSGSIVFGSRSNQITDDNGVPNSMPKSFKRAAEFVAKNVLANTTMSDRYDLTGLVFFGECCVKHSMNYNFADMPAFLGFDVYDTHTLSYLEYDEVVRLYGSLGLPVVPLIVRLSAAGVSDFLNEDAIPGSRYGSFKAEGVVFKNYAKQLMAKLVTASFKEVNRKVFGGSPKFASSGADWIVAKYCTNARVEKMIHKIEDENGRVSMKDMGKLLGMVHNDIWTEHCFSILKNCREIIPRDVKKGVAVRCRSVLEMVIAHRGISGLEPIDSPTIEEALALMAPVEREHRRVEKKL